MNLNFLCCIGAELKNSTQQTTRMSQIYLYRAFESETVDDMLSPGFFNAALGIIRQDDLLLLYGPNDAKARYVYARVAEVNRDGVIIEKITINAKDVYVNTAGMTNLQADNLQDLVYEIDEQITRLDEKIDDEIERAKTAEGDLVLPVITDGSAAPNNLSEAIRQLNEQNIATITPDDQAPNAGNWTLWAAIKKCFANIVNFFNALVVVNSRLNALEGRGGPVGSYDFGKTFPNELDTDDSQKVLTVMVDNIWPGNGGITWETPLSNSTFKDAIGIERTVGEIFNATWIRNSYDGTRIVLTNTPDTTPPVFSLQNVGVDVVGYANETTAGIVRTGSGSDMITNQSTGDISIDDSKGYSIWNRITALFNSTQQAQIRKNLGVYNNYQKVQNLGALTAAQTITMNSNTADIYLLDNSTAPIAASTITLNLPSTTTADCWSFQVRIKIGSTVPGLTWPTGIKWVDGADGSISDANKTSIFIIEKIGTDIVASYGGSY